MSQAQVQAQAVLQAQALLHAHSQAHSNAVAQIRARAQGFIPPLTAAAIPATLSLFSRAGVTGDTSSHQQLLSTPPSAGLPAPGTFLPSGRMQPASFVVGPGFLPIPDKTVSNIVSGQFIDLASLLAKPSDARSASPLICIDGQVIVSQASKPPRRLTDISQWLQAFAIYMLVMVTYWPSRAADLIRYQLLILRTHAQFGGLAWYNYKPFAGMLRPARLRIGRPCMSSYIIFTRRLQPDYLHLRLGRYFAKARAHRLVQLYVGRGTWDVVWRLAQSAVISIFAICLAVGEVTAAFIALIKPLVAPLLFPPSPPPRRYSPT